MVEYEQLSSGEIRTLDRRHPFRQQALKQEVYMAKKNKLNGAALAIKAAEAFVTAAIDKYNDEGRVEVDVKEGNEALESVSFVEGDFIPALRENGGAYVKAWVWVDITDLTSAARETLGLQEED